MAAKDLTSGKELKFTISLGQMQEKEVEQAREQISRITVG